MNPTLCRHARPFMLAGLLACSTAGAQEIREACAAILHTAAYASLASDRQKSIEEFESKNCTKDITDAYGPAGVPKAGSRSALAMMAMTFASIKSGVRLAAENERLRAGKPTLTGISGTIANLATGNPSSGGGVGTFKKGNLYTLDIIQTPTGPDAVFKPARREGLER